MNWPDSLLQFEILAQEPAEPAFCAHFLYNLAAFYEPALEEYLDFIIKHFSIRELRTSTRP